MDEKKPKRLIILYILEILKKHTDGDHRLNQNEIVELLSSEYDMNIDRRTVKNNIEDLIDHGYDISFDRKSRLNAKREEKSEKEKFQVKDKFYLERDITDGELRLLMETILFSKDIPYNFRKDLVEKLKKLSSVHFSSQLNHHNEIGGTRKKNLKNLSLFSNIEDLEEAIGKSKKISFAYNEYRLDENLQLELKAKTEDNGSEKRYVINPYGIVSTNGRYYLICNADQYDNISHYRLERITDIEILEEERKPIEKFRGFEFGLDLEKHMEEHIYMFSGASEDVRIEFKKEIMNDFIDWFGTEKIRFIEEREKEFLVEVKVNRNAMKKWALQYGLYARVLSPESLVEEIREDIRQVEKNYS